MKQIEQTIITVEIAEMMEVEHADILKKLQGTPRQKGIIPVLSEGNFPVADYFQESTYEDAQGKPRKCYKVTKLGCDFLANKFTGEKGILFTARYVKRFHEMEEVIKKPKTTFELLEMEFKALKEVECKVDEVNDDLQKFKKDMPILGIECERITKAKNRKVTNLLGGHETPAYKDNSLRGRVYRDLEKQLKREFGIESYKEIKRNQTGLAVEIINSYKLPLILEQEIKNVNAQITFVGA